MKFPKIGPGVESRLLTSTFFEFFEMERNGRKEFGKFEYEPDGPNGRMVSTQDQDDVAMFKSEVPDWLKKA